MSGGRGLRAVAARLPARFRAQEAGRFCLLDAKSREAQISKISR